MSAGGPVLDAAVLVSDARRQALVDAGEAVPDPQYIRALLDTGASHTSIDPVVFTALGLTPTGSVEVCTPTTGKTSVSADTFDVGLAILAARQGEAHLILPTWKVSSSELFEMQNIHALIGRDVLARCVLSYNGAENTFTLAY
jgi:hypothetical protein